MNRNQLVANSTVGITVPNLPPDTLLIASMSTSADNPAGAVFVLEAQYNGEDWITVTMDNPAATDRTLTVANLTGVSKAGSAQLVGAQGVRARRTDATGGNGDVSLNVAIIRGR